MVKHRCNKGKASSSRACNVSTEHRDLSVLATAGCSCPSAASLMLSARKNIVSASCSLPSPSFHSPKLHVDHARCLSIHLMCNVGLKTQPDKYHRTFFCTKNEHEQHIHTISMNVYTCGSNILCDLSDQTSMQRHVRHHTLQFHNTKNNMCYTHTCLWFQFLLA